MQQPVVHLGYFYCSACQLAINRNLQNVHIRKCRGELDLEPIVIPNKKQLASNLIECSICQNIMSLEKFKYHEYFCTEAMVPCEFCNRQIYKFRWDDHKENCSIYLQSQRIRQQQLMQRLKRYFLVLYGVEIDSQISADTFNLLINQVLPALQKMDKGMRNKEIDSIESKEFQREQLEMCTICLDNIYRGEIIKELNCKHVFHRKCVDQWLANSANCPNCRQDIKKNK